MSAKIKRTCKHCGKEFEIYASALSGKTNSSGNYCSRKCYNEEQKTFTGEKNNHYTSVIVSCANCGKEIKKIPSRLKEYKNAFCSMKCKAEYHHNYIEGEKNCNWKGGASRFRGDDFEDVKKKYYSGKRCAICGTKQKIHIHHIIPYRLTHDNSTDNLIPLCTRHHKWFESLTVPIIEKSENYKTSQICIRSILADTVMSMIGKRMKYAREYQN